MIPKDLTRDKKCYAFKMDKLDINEKFSTLLREAEKELQQALQQRFETVKGTFEMDIELIDDNIKQVEFEGRVSAQEWAEHAHYMWKTNDNLEKTTKNRLNEI